MCDDCYRLSPEFQRWVRQKIQDRRERFVEQENRLRWQDRAEADEAFAERVAQIREDTRQWAELDTDPWEQS